MRKIDFKKALTLVVILFTSSLFAQTTFNYSGTIVDYTVPAGTFSISIDAIGAAGGIRNISGASTGVAGKGAQIVGTFNVTPGEILKILVGEQGESAEFVAGGGGGTFVWRSTGDELLVAAGGGGGGGYTDATLEYIDGLDATVTQLGTNGNGFSDGAGTLGNGATTPSVLNHAAGGTGWLTSAVNGNNTFGCTNVNTGGSTPLSGGAGGNAGGTTGLCGNGGFGGGGGANGRCGAVGAGGGGGYSGGGAGGEQISNLYGGGGGGGSFNGGTDTSAMAGVGTSNGVVVITELCNPLQVTNFNDTICLESQITLNITSQTGGTITWNNAVINNTAFSPSNEGTNTYIATSSNPGDCDYTASIEVLALPTVSIVADNNEICEGEQVTLTATGTPSNYSWNENIQNGVAFAPTNTGMQTYTLNATDNLTSCVNTESINVNVYEAIEINSNLTNAGSGSNGAIDLMVTGGDLNYIYDWDTDGTGDFDDLEDLTNLSNGNYTVVVNDSVGCSNSKTFTLDKTTGIDDFDISELQIFPNPTTGIINIKTTESLDYISIIDYTGKIVKVFDGSNTQIDISDFNLGVYFIEIANAKKKSVIKFIKK